MIFCPNLKHREFGFYENFKKEIDCVKAWNSHRFDIHRQLDETTFQKIKKWWKNEK